MGLVILLSPLLHPNQFFFGNLPVGCGLLVEVEPFAKSISISAPGAVLIQRLTCRFSSNRHVGPFQTAEQSSHHTPPEEGLRPRFAVDSRA